MTQEEIITQEDIEEKIRNTFREGDRVFVRFFPNGGIWCIIRKIDYEFKTIRFNPEGPACISFDEALKCLSFTEYTLEPVGLSQERPKPKKKNGDPFEEGDEVWLIRQIGIRKGVVVRVDKTRENTYPILVRETDGIEPEEWLFTSNGRFSKVGDIALFHQKPIITFED